MEKLTVKSSAFESNGKIPAKYTCDGENVNPPLSISGLPEGTASLALLVEDPDAPGGVFRHWAVWNISAGTMEVGENSVPQGAIEGANDFGEVGWGAPCPPSGSHRYVFKIYALDVILELGEGASRAELTAAMEDHVLASGELVGLYR